MDFKIGDTVQVKSGGPLLTVLETSGETVTCLFFSDEIGNFQRDSFPALVLEEVEIVEEDEDEPKAKKTAGRDDEDDLDDEDMDDEEDEADDKKHAEKAA